MAKKKEAEIKEATEVKEEPVAKKAKTAAKKEEPVAEAIETTEAVAEDKVEEQILNPTLQKKKEAREAKAARKEKNKFEEEHKRPSNKVLAIFIFGIIILMFLFIWGYNYFNKEASIQSYIKNNGGKSTYSNIDIGDGSTMSVTAKKNDMTILFKVETDDAKAAKKNYKKKSSIKYIKYIGAYYLSTIKPQTRAITAKADCVIKINGKKFATHTVKYKEAEDIIEDFTGAASEE